MLRAIIIDDEQPAREALGNYVAEFCTDVKVVAMAESAKTGKKAIEAFHPDLVFLDVEMPNGSGFDLLREYEKIPFRVIFVTAYSEYAVKAFRFYATDYLMKPISIKELVEAVEKVKKEMNHDLGSVNLEALTKFIRNPDEEIRTIIIPDMAGFHVLEIGDIIRCEAHDYCTDFFSAGGKKITSSKTLKHYEELLADFYFIRVHNSHMVNMKHVKGYLHEGTIQLSENHSAPLGNTYKKRFLDLFQRK
jgi:two-component system, LytTR family, response regulator